MRTFFTAIMLDFYTPAHLVTLFFAPAMFCALYFSLRHKSEKVKIRTLMCVFIANTALFIAYKIFMGATYDTFVLLNELPLHLCNFNLILFPIALKTKNKFLFSYLYYIGPLGAFAAVLFFDTTFLHKSIFDFGVFCYFFYHSLLVASSVIIPALKIFTPKLTDIFKSLATLFALVLIMHIINTIFRKSGACDIANYFYTYGMEGNPLLGSLYNLIPVPVIYLLPIAPVAIILNSLMYLPFHKQNKELRRVAAQNTENTVNA